MKRIAGRRPAAAAWGRVDDRAHAIAERAGHGFVARHDLCRLLQRATAAARQPRPPIA